MVQRPKVFISTQTKHLTENLDKLKFKQNKFDGWGTTSCHNREFIPVSNDKSLINLYLSSKQKLRN